MIAHRVAAPVLERAPAHGVVAGVAGTAAYLEFDGSVVAVTARGVPLMPNGVALTGDLGAPVVGTAVQLTASGLRGAGWGAAWSAAEPPVWDPSVPRASDAGAEWP